MRLIDADTLEDVVTEINNRWEIPITRYEFKRIESVLFEMPTIEAVPVSAAQDEDFRIASEIRIAVGCDTSKECWELVRRGDIQRVKHGRWKGAGMGDYMCSLCATIVSGNRHHYCPNCGCMMDEVEE